jgi:hypothetical protein
MTPDWNPNWDDWQNLVWQKLEKMDARMTKMEKFYWKLIGGGLAIIGIIEIVAQFVRVKGA